MKRSSSLFSLFAAGVFAIAMGASAPAFAQAQPAATPTSQPAKETVKQDKKEKKHDKKDDGKVAAVGSMAPDFELKDTDGKTHKLSDLTKQGKIVVLEWFNPECPYVQKHYTGSSKTFNEMNKAFAGKNVVMLAINSNKAGAPGSGVERNAKAKKDWGIEYPILIDEAGTVGKSYGAKNTPAMFVIAADGTLAYSGAIDDDDSPKGPGKTNYVTKAVDELLAKKPVTTKETKAYGCNVKY